MKTTFLFFVSLSLMLSSCRTHTKDVADLYEWPHIRNGLYWLKYQEERKALLKEKGYVDYCDPPGKWAVTTEWAPPGDSIENKYDVGFNDGWSFIHSSATRFSSTGSFYRKTINKIKEMRKNKDKGEYARGFLDAVNESQRIENEARKRAEEFISSFRAWYLEHYPYYARYNRGWWGWIGEH